MARGTLRRASWRRSSMELAILIATLSPFSNYSATQTLFARPHLPALGAIAALAVRADRVDGRAFLQASLRQDGRNIRGESTLQRLRRHEHVVADAMLVQRLAIHDQRLRVGTLQFDGRGHEAFDRVRDIVR